MKNKNNLLTMAIIAIIAISAILIIYSLYENKDRANYGLEKITYKELKTKQEKKEDFILIISKSDCSHCATYKPKVQQIAKDNKIIVYYIDIDKTADPEAFLKEYNLKGATPMTLFFKTGKETSILNRIEGDKITKIVIEQFKKMGFI